MAERDQVVYGLTKNITTHNPVKVAWHEFYAIGRDVAAATSWRQRWQCAFGSPGWVAQGEPVRDPVAVGGNPGSRQPSN